MSDDNDEFYELNKERIKYLETELTKYNACKEEKEKLEKSVNEYKKNNFDLTNQNKEYQYKIQFLTKENEANKKKLTDLSKDISKISDYKAKITELEKNLTEKTKECENLKIASKSREDSLKGKLDTLKETCEISKEKALGTNELQKKYDRLKSDYLVQKDKCNRYDQLEKEFQQYKKAVESKGQAPVSQSAKNEIEKLKKERDAQLAQIKDLKKKISQYEARLEMGQTPKKPETEANTYADENYVKEMNERLKEVTEELDRCNQVKDNLAQYYQTESNQMKSRYQKEFELMSSAIYNLGFNLNSMKRDYEEKLRDQGSWLFRRRQVILSGDY